MKTAKIIKIPESKREELRKAYKSSKTLKQATRYHSLWLLSMGKSKQEVSELLDCGINSMREWLTLYYKGGIKALKLKKQNKPTRWFLSQDQKASAVDIIKTKTPKDFGLESDFWSIKALRRVVKKAYGVEYKSDTSYRQLLYAAGFSYHKPVKKNAKQQEGMKEQFRQKLKKSSGEMVTTTMSW